MVYFNVDLLERLMKESNLNGSQLARKIGVTRSCISKILNDQKRIPETETLLKLCEWVPQYSVCDFILADASTNDYTAQKMES